MKKNILCFAPKNFKVFMKKDLYFLKTNSLSYQLPFSSTSCLFFIYDDYFYVVNKSLSKTLFNKTKTILCNVIKGSGTQYFERLSISGVGYRFIKDTDKNFFIKLGYSHNVSFKVPFNISFFFLSSTELCFVSENYSSLKLFLLEVKRLRFPDAYKGKGIFYSNEKVLLKSIQKKS